MIYTKKPVTLGAVRLVQPKAPRRAGAYWQALKHSEFIDLVMAKASRYWKVKAPRCCVSKSGELMVAGVELDGGSAPEGALLSLGLYNKNDWGSRVKLYAGLWLEEEQCGLPLAEFTLARHDHYQLGDLPGHVFGAIEQMKKSSKSWPGQVRAWQKQQQPQNYQEGLVYMAAREGVIPHSYVGHVFNGPLDGSVWGLLKSFALACKKITPARQMQSVYQFKRML